MIGVLLFQGHYKLAHRLLLILQCNDGVDQSVNVRGGELRTCLFQLALRVGIFPRLHVGTRHQIQQHRRGTVLLRNLIQRMNGLGCHTGASGEGDMDRRKLCQHRILVHFTHLLQRLLGQIQTVQQDVNLDTHTNLLQGGSVVDTHQCFLLHPSLQKDMSSRQLNTRSHTIAQHALQLMNYGLCLSLAAGHGERFVLCLQSQCVHARRLPRNDFPVVFHGNVASRNEFLSFLLELRTHWTSHDALALIQGHLVVAQPKLGSQSVQFIGFRHGRWML
mmetsp:Transcript_18697/g.33727  ORF Transcript_18697/g.33727 Transcript_18697/m.33727 type:complete len:276 (+) Transcript_18697:237-1064(+)